VPPLGEGDERFAFVDFSLKAALVRTPLVRAALIGSISTLTLEETGVLAVGRAGGVAQFCLKAACESSFVLSSNLTLAGQAMMVNSVGAIVRASRRVSLLFEADALVPLGNELATYNGMLVGGGLRFHWAHWGLDLAVLRGLRGGPPLPVLALTYRSL